MKFLIVNLLTIIAAASALLGALWQGFLFTGDLGGSWPILGGCLLVLAATGYRAWSR